MCNRIGRSRPDTPILVQSPGRTAGIWDINLSSPWIHWLFFFKTLVMIVAMKSRTRHNIAYNSRVTPPKCQLSHMLSNGWMLASLRRNYFISGRKELLCPGCLQGLSKGSHSQAPKPQPVMQSACIITVVLVSIFWNKVGNRQTHLEYLPQWKRGLVQHQFPVS